MTAPQRLQALRPPGRIRHAEALRLRPLALEVFFLGTAMRDPDLQRPSGPLRPASLPATGSVYTSVMRGRAAAAGPVGKRSGTGPAQSSEHSGASGRASIAVSRAAGAKSMR